jgi:chemotaxis protein methyltransferase CheR
MRDGDCVELLQWALPRLGLRWAGFRGLHGQVCKRIGRRLAALGLPDGAAYRVRLEGDAAEWEVLRGLCTVTISRLYRDRAVWDALRGDVLPALAGQARAAGEPELRCWSAGCASGEEPYTLSMAWALDLAPRYPGLRLRLLATDLDERLLGRARLAEYRGSTIKELPEGWRERAFEAHGDRFRLRAELRDGVELVRGDLRSWLPGAPVRLILCRNVVFTYFDDDARRATLERLVTVLAPGGALVVGSGERIPPGSPLAPWHPALGIFSYDRRWRPVSEK